MAFPAQASSSLEFCKAEEGDFEQVMVMSAGVYDGLDFIAACYHSWLKEPGRLVFLAKEQNRVVALMSVLLVDGGETIMGQGLRVAASERGRGIATAIRRHVTEHVRHHYPQVTACRLAKADDKCTPELLAKYRLLAKESILSLCCDVADLGPFLLELQSKLSREAELVTPVTLNQLQAETLVLSNHVVSTLLPGHFIISDWESLKPVLANLEVLRRRGHTWIADHEFKPAALSLCSKPFKVPYRQDALQFSINIFSRSLGPVCAMFLAQLAQLQPHLHGYLVFHTFVEPQLWQGLSDFCQNSGKVSFFKDYWEEFILEGDL
ncbi:histidine N-acetyltransferase-like [Lampris incognitus]|uniref:histidine N-acetyltransferase-like n=1 Tax=Lampris incognitus TaxID=2546036 RepID=UPI0024B4B81D|nr:histidine N-acetyltransferase-like [Lampris incognitus]